MSGDAPRVKGRAPGGAPGLALPSRQADLFGSVPTTGGADDDDRAAIWHDGAERGAEFRFTGDDGDRLPADERAGDAGGRVPGAVRAGGRARADGRGRG